MKKYFTKLWNLLCGKYTCSVCSSKVCKFNMIGEDYLKQFESSLFPHSIFAFETLNIFGYSCPSCGSSDRARLYKLFINKYLSTIKNKKISVLEIAPDPMLSAYFKNNSIINYRSADITGYNVDDKIDVTAMTSYEDNRFNFILCSHVLEHVSDDHKAMKELFRVLKVGGKAIVMVPILLTITEIDEDDTVITPDARMKRFGQDDHVRLYSKDGFVSRLCEVGFIVNQYDIDFFGADNFRTHGILDRSVLYVVEKFNEAT